MKPFINKYYWHRINYSPGKDNLKAFEKNNPKQTILFLIPNGKRQYYLDMRV